MYAKLILIAEKISFDEMGRVSATNLLLDTVQPSFPATLESMDLLTLWTRTPDEPSRQMFELSLRIGDQVLDPEHIPIDFKEGYEAWQGISLDGFQIERPCAVVFHFTQSGEDRGVWVMRVHPQAEPVGDAK